MAHKTMRVLHSSDLRRLHSILLERADETLHVPELEVLAELLSTAFWAGLEREESRPVSFTLIFEPVTCFGTDASLILDEALEFNVINLVKFAPAILRGRRAMAVFLGPEGRLLIRGTTPLPTRAFTIEATEPGSLWIRLLDDNLAAFRSGSLTYLANDHSDNLLFLVNYVSEYELELTPAFTLVCEALEKVIQAMVRHGHGGTILWVPFGSGWKTGVKSIRYICEPPFGALVQVLKDLYPEGPPDFQAHPGNYRNNPVFQELAMRLPEIQQTVDEVGQLTAVDGAMVIRETLEVLAFGVMLRAEALDSNLIVRVLELGKHSQLHEGGFHYDETPIALLGGTRHRSAAEFVCEHPDTLAFVASQDGGLTIFGWQQKSGRLFAIRNAQLALT